MHRTDDRGGSILRTEKLIKEGTDRGIDPGSRRLGGRSVLDIFSRYVVGWLVADAMFGDRMLRTPTTRRTKRTELATR